MDQTKNIVGITIHIDRALAIAAGNAHHGEQRVTVDLADLTPSERATLATLYCGVGMQNDWNLANGFSLIDERDAGVGSHPYRRPMLCRADLAGVKAVLAAVADAILAYRLRRDCIQAEVLAWSKPAAERGDLDSQPWRPESNYQPKVVTWKADGTRVPAPKELWPVMAELREAKVAAEESQRKEAESKALAERQRKENEKRAVDEALVKAYGTPDQVERWTAGVLPQRELDALAEAEAFGGDCPLKEYTPITLADLDHHETCDVSTEVMDESEEQKSDASDEEKLSVSVKTPSELGTTQWAALKAVRQVYPEDKGYKAEVRVHHCKCDECGATMSRSAVHVVKYLGPYRSTKAFAVPVPVIIVDDVADND